jgi:hypothetical protein
METHINLLGIPENILQITPVWLTQALKYKGSTSEASVVSYSVETIGQEFGFMNHNARIRIEYDSDSDGLPDSAIIKLPSTDHDLRTIGSKIGNAMREVRFYEELSADSILQTPHSYYGAADPETGRTFLLLEDMGTASKGDSVVGCSIEQATLAMSELAKFHDVWWENPGLEQLEWLPLRESDAVLYQNLYAEGWELLAKQIPSGMPRALEDISDRIYEAIPDLKSQLTKSPQTIVHGDYRPDNFFFGTCSDSSSFVVFDWEFCVRGRGVYDVATFISEAFTPERRKDVEMDLLRHYHASITKNITGAYSFEECVDDYRTSIMEVFAFWVAIGGFCDFGGERATTFLQNAAERFSAAISDLDCADLLR